MKSYIHTAAILAATISISAAALPLPIPDLITKEWHSSPPISINSRIFGVIDWDRMPTIKIGITEKELRAISPMIAPVKNMNGLIYSISPAGIRYEIGVLIDQGQVSDISYKVSEDVKTHRTFGASMLAQPPQITKKANKSEQATPRKPSD